MIPSHILLFPLSSIIIGNFCASPAVAAFTTSHHRNVVQKSFHLMSNRCLNGNHPCRMLELRTRSSFGIPHYSKSNDEDINPSSPLSPSNSEDCSIDNNCDANNSFTLHWNLPALLSQEPQTQAKLIALMDVYNAAVKELQRPESLEYTGELPQSIAPFRRFVRKYNVDMGHDGRFTIFNDKCQTNEKNVKNNDESKNQSFEMEGASMQANAVFAMDNPLTFIREALTCGKSSRSIDTDQCKDETIIFVPGCTHVTKTRGQIINLENGKLLPVGSSTTLVYSKEFQLHNCILAPILIKKIFT